MNFFYLLGILGASLILLGFLLRGNKKYGIGTFPYQIINLTGSVFLVLYAIDGNVLPFIILNTVWAGDSSLAMMRILRKKS